MTEGWENTSTHAWWGCATGIALRSRRDDRQRVQHSLQALSGMGGVHVQRGTPQAGLPGPAHIGAPVHAALSQAPCSRSRRRGHFRCARALLRVDKGTAISSAASRARALTPRRRRAPRPAPLAYGVANWAALATRILPALSAFPQAGCTARPPRSARRLRRAQTRGRQSRLCRSGCGHGHSARALPRRVS